MNHRYLESRFLPGENLIARAELHWMVFWPAIRSFILFIVFGIASLWMDKSSKNFYTILELFFLLAGAFSLVLSLVSAIWSFLELLRYDFVLTNKRLVIKNGILHVRMFELMLNKVEGISISQSFLGRWLGFGTFHITTGGAEQLYPDIKNVVWFHNTVLEQMQKSRKEDDAVVAGLSSSATMESLLQMLAKMKEKEIEQARSLPENQ